MLSVLLLLLLYTRTYRLEENARGHTNYRMQRKQKYFGVKDGNGKNVTERLNGLRTWEKNYKESNKS